MCSSSSEYHLRSAHISICDGHSFGLDGGLSGDTAPLLQGHLSVWRPVGAGGPRGTGPESVWRGHAAGGHGHGRHPVCELCVVLGVQLRPSGGVTTHGGRLWFLHSQTAACSRSSGAAIVPLGDRSMKKEQRMQQTPLNTYRFGFFKYFTSKGINSSSKLILQITGLLKYADLPCLRFQNRWNKNNKN